MNVNKYVKVNSIEEAYALLKENPRNKILGGGLLLKKANANIDTLIDLSALGLDKIEDDGEFISIGALVSEREIEKSELIQGIYHGLISNATSQIMGPAFRNVATIGGTIVSRSGFSDLLTALLACKVILNFYPSGQISLADYLKNPINEVLTHVLIKKCHRKSYFKKVAITALDYPLVNVAITHCVNHDQYTIVVGSRPGVASYAIDAMNAINNGEKDFTKVSQEIAKMSFADSLSSKADYRLHLAKTYVLRGLEEVNK